MFASRTARKIPNYRHDRERAKHTGGKCEQPEEYPPRRREWVRLGADVAVGPVIKADQPKGREDERQQKCGANKGQARMLFAVEPRGLRGEGMVGGEGVHARRCRRRVNTIDLVQMALDDCGGRVMGIS